MNRVIQVRTADEVSDLVGANIHAKSARVEVFCSTAPNAALVGAVVCKMPGVKHEFALVELRYWNNNTLQACAAAGALARWWPVLITGNELRGDQAGTCEMLRLAKEEDVVLPLTVIMARSNPEKVLASIIQTRERPTCSNWEVETFLTDMTKARHVLEPRGAQVLRCEIQDVHSTVLKELKRG